jgi:hypothetical protein
VDGVEAYHLIPARGIVKSDVDIKADALYLRLNE